MSYSDWKSESGSYLFYFSGTEIDYFGLNFRHMLKVKTRIPSYFYLEGGVHYGIISYSQSSRHPLAINERIIPKDFKTDSWGIQYGGSLHYGITRRLDLITKFSFHNSFFDYIYLEERSHFSFGFHFGLSYKFIRQLNPFKIK